MSLSPSNKASQLVHKIRHVCQSINSGMSVIIINIIIITKKVNVKKRRIDVRLW